MKIYAVADVHYPRFARSFEEALSGLAPPDLFLLTGDIVNRGSAEEYPRVLDAIQDSLGSDFPLIGCYGNEEYSDIRGKIVKYVNDRMILLDEKSTTVMVDGKSLGIVGTQGSLDKPTSWQKKNVSGIKDIFARRAVRAESLLKRLAGKVDYRILLMHYSPCIETCEGEDSRDFAWLGSRKFYKVLTNVSPDLVVHGHVHNATVFEAKVGATLVRNVALPAVGRITELEITL
ncbi:MAG: metallophosphoesterase [Candidatus Thorarchaeota archaeon]|nr:metallophosphoesterase [Candidatus Thorarchaeota archaeon]